MRFVLPNTRTLDWCPTWPESRANFRDPRGCRLCTKKSRCVVYYSRLQQNVTQYHDTFLLLYPACNGARCLIKFGLENCRRHNIDPPTDELWLRRLWFFGYLCGVHDVEARARERRWSPFTTGRRSNRGRYSPGPRPQGQRRSCFTKQVSQAAQYAS